MPDDEASQRWADFDEISPAELRRRMNLVRKGRRALRAKQNRTPAYGGTPWVPPVYPEEAQLAQLDVSRGILAALVTLIASGTTPSIEPKTVPQPAKKATRGKCVEARMLKILAENQPLNDKPPTEWLSSTWAEQLGCSPSMVRGTKTWKVHLPKLRRQLAAERSKSLDDTRTKNFRSRQRDCEPDNG